jgi:hypothetical protein
VESRAVDLPGPNYLSKFTGEITLHTCEIAEQTFCPKFGKITIANRYFSDLLFG